MGLFDSFRKQSQKQEAEEKPSVSQEQAASETASCEASTEEDIGCGLEGIARFEVLHRSAVLRRSAVRNLRRGLI